MNLHGVEVTAVLIASLISFAIGALWLSPALFGNLWLKASKIPAGDYSRYINGRSFFLLALFVIGLNTGLSSVIDILGYSNMIDGIYAGISLWVMFALPLCGILMTFDRRSFIVLLIYSGYFLVTFVITSALCVMWR